MFLPFINTILLRILNSNKKYKEKIKDENPLLKKNKTKKTKKQKKTLISISTRVIPVRSGTIKIDIWQKI